MHNQVQTLKRYQQSEAFKVSMKRYRQSEKGKVAQKRAAERYRQNHKEKCLQSNIKYHQKHRVEHLQHNKQYYKTLTGYLRCLWHRILNRCNNPKNKDYHRYGGRNIRVKFESFEDFYNYVVNVLKAEPRGLTIDRIDNDGNYEKGNIRFVSRTENNRNKRRKS